MIRLVVLLAVAVALWPAGTVPRLRSPDGAASGRFRSPVPSSMAVPAPSSMAVPGAAPRPGRLVPLIALTAIAAGAVSPVAGIGSVCAGAVLVVSSRRSAVAGRRRALVAALPAALDLCTVVLGAGGTLRDALGALADQGPGPVRDAATAACRRIGAGATLDDALRGLRSDLGPVFQPLTGALLLANEQGGSVGLLLARLAGEASAGRRRTGELRARRLPVALLGPLIVCSLPAVLIGAVLPLALVSLADLDR